MKKTVREKEIQGYLRAVWKAARCSLRRKADLAGELRDSIGLYLEECPGAGLQEIEEEFGSPQEIAQSFLEQEEGSGARYLPLASRAVLAGFALYFSLFSAFTGTRLYSLEAGVKRGEEYRISSQPVAIRAWDREKQEYSHEVIIMAVIDRDGEETPAFRPDSHMVIGISPRPEK